MTKHLPGITEESSTDEEDAYQHPSCHSCHALGVGAVGGDGVENVDQHLNSVEKDKWVSWKIVFSWK